MKSSEEYVYVQCDGRTLEARNVSEVTFRLTASNIPIKAHGTRLMRINEARALMRQLLDSGLYEGGRTDDATATRNVGVKLVTG